MNSSRPKITAAVVLTLAVIAGVYTFWYTRTKPVAKSQDIKNLQEKEEPAPKMARSDEVYLKGPQARKSRSGPPKLNQKQSSFADTEPNLKYADSLQAQKHGQQLFEGQYYRRHPGIADSEKVSESLVEPPQGQPEQFDTRARSVQHLSRLKSKKPVEQHRAELPEGDELKISEEQMRKMHENFLLHLLEEYKDNPEQAEQIREILLERFEYLQQQRAAANKETNKEK